MKKDGFFTDLTRKKLLLLESKRKKIISLTTLLNEYLARPSSDGHPSRQIMREALKQMLQT